MSKRVLLCLSHSIEEYDQLRLLSGLGYEVASLGGYIDPRNPHDDKRPGLDIPFYPELKEAVDSQGVEDNIGRAQENLPDAVLEWLGADGIVIYHHYLSRLFGQWDHLRDWRSGGGRVVWRTVGQSVESNEVEAAPYREDGLEIVRYSPKEKNIPGYCGEDAMIRFYKDPAEWEGWTGEAKFVTNVSQHLAQRDPWTNYTFFQAATEGLPVRPFGPGAEHIGGLGQLTLDAMKNALRGGRCYLYTGTQPASYTLGFIEAMMTGIPVVSIGPAHMTIFPYGPDLYEAHELCGLGFDDPAQANAALSKLLEDKDAADRISQHQRHRARTFFGIEPVGRAWADFLG